MRICPALRVGLLLGFCSIKKKKRKNQKALNAHQSGAHKSINSGSQMQFYQGLRSIPIWQLKVELAVR